jgi:hypothetical protein
MKEMETLDAKEFVASDSRASIEGAFAQHENASDMCTKSQIAIQNNIVNLRVNATTTTQAGACDDDYDAGF